MLWRGKAVGWCSDLRHQPQAHRTGVPAVAADGKSVFDATGGNYECGAERFTLRDELKLSVREA